jgi:hypothetical protein
MSFSFKKVRVGIVTIIVFVVVFLAIVFSLKNQPKATVKNKILDRDYTSKTENMTCLECHSKAECEYKDPSDSTILIRKKMPVNCIIDTLLYYNSNHWDFKCTDCHSDEYSKAPHDSTLKEAEISTCLDCHLDDEQFTKYHFDKIESEFRKSTHAGLDTLGFSCWSCHNGHYNKVNERDIDESVMDIVAYGNKICLDCHSDTSKYNKFGKPLADLVEKHNWLPYLSNHFDNVRCIDCHTAINDTILADHFVLPKEESVRECAACHSTNSILYKTLYERRKITDINKFGFYNSVILKEQLVIGSNRNYYLNLISMVIFIIVSFVVILHIALRILIIKKKKE